MDWVVAPIFLHGYNLLNGPVVVIIVDVHPHWGIFGGFVMQVETLVAQNKVLVAISVQISCFHRVPPTIKTV